MGTGLSSLGRKQADLTGRRLKEEGIEEIFHSPMERARESAKIIRNHFPESPIHSTKTLTEISPPYPKTQASSRCQTEAAIKEQLDRLIERFFHASREGARCKVFVAHGNLIRGLICSCMKLPKEKWIQLQLDHGSLTMFEVTSEHEILLHCMNDVGHIPAHLRSCEHAHG